MNNTEELTLLREFHTRWVAFHKIERTKDNRIRQEASAERMTDAHHALEAYYRSLDKTAETQAFRKEWNG